MPAEEQPYDVPENWVWVRLGAVAETISKGTTPKGGSAAYVDEGVNFLRVENLTSDGYISHSKITHITEEMHENYLKRSILKANDLLISIAGSLGKSAIVRECDLPINTNQAIAFVRLFCNEVNVNYIRNTIESPLINSTLTKQTKVTSIPNLTLEIIKDCPIPLPPLFEQQRIVERIEELFEKLDEAKERLQEVADSFAVRKAAILHKAFTGELTKQWRRENGVSDESWEEKKLGEVGPWLGGGTPSTSHEEYWENGNILWVTSKDMKSTIIEDTLMKVNEIGVKNSSANYIDEPALLVVMRSGILRRTFPVAMVKKPFTVNQDLKAIVPDKDDLEFLFWMLLSNEQLILNTCMKNGTTVESINSKALKEFAFKCPSLPEQHEIVRLIDDLLARERSAQQAAEQALASIDLMKKSILARAFRGELGTNKASEASALELLKQVLAEN